jgi:2'-hydroxyisoflavone reductase
VSTRRQFIVQASATAALPVGGLQLSNAAPAQTNAARPIRILLLGATGFLGPHFVRAAAERGHSVAVFSRGRKDADLPPQVERLIGDRSGDLRSISGRDWDAVIDLATFVPVWVRTLGAALKGRVRHYTFISTIDVYKDPSARPDGTKEGDEVLTYDGHGDRYAQDGGGGSYGSLKVLCENEAEKQFLGSALIVRPGHMVGPSERQERFIYWVARLERGGDVLAPGNPIQPVQFIDLRDVAEWIVRMAERGETGVYNALGPATSMGMCEMLGAIRGISAKPVRLRWVSIPWISHQGIISSDALEWRIWRFSRDDAINCEKARAQGLTCRPLATTAMDTLRWYQSLPEVQRSNVLVNYKKATEGAWEPVRATWSTIEQCEREIIARWRVHAGRMI